MIPALAMLLAVVFFCCTLVPDPIHGEFSFRFRWSIPGCGNWEKVCINGRWFVMEMEDGGELFPCVSEAHADHRLAMWNRR